MKSKLSSGCILSRLEWYIYTLNEVQPLNGCYITVINHCNRHYCSRHRLKVTGMHCAVVTAFSPLIYTRDGLKSRRVVHLYFITLSPPVNSLLIPTYNCLHIPKWIISNNLSTWLSLHLCFLSIMIWLSGQSCCYRKIFNTGHYLKHKLHCTDYNKELK